METPKKQIKKIEKKAEKVTNYIKNHPDSTSSDEEGNVINQYPGKGKTFVPIKEDVNEDLAVWFGTKKKPKGSSQPKGPWVNICRKVDGKHPPCGRSDTDKGAYPKCRAAGVAGKMSDSEKRSACQQKRTAEKKDTQTGKGQKPVMTSYKTKKTQKESLNIIVRNILSGL
jgi:beta-lactam-binding protein with PASTA domain